MVVFSHHAGGHRRSATFLCNHLASHGYVVASLDHSEVVAKELRRHEGETAAMREARIDAIVGSRVPDVRFLINRLLAPEATTTGDASAEFRIDAERIGLAGHSSVVGRFLRPRRANRGYALSWRWDPAGVTTQGLGSST